MQVRGGRGFVEAHNERLKDARALLREQRWSGAVYLGGYAIECLLKALIVRRRGLNLLPRDYWHHDLRRLIESALFKIEREERMTEELRGYVQLLCKEWDVTLRYGERRYNRHSATRLLACVEVLRQWLLRVLK